MFVTFDKQYLQDLYQEGKTSDKKYRFQPEIVKAYAKCIYRLEEAKNTEELYRHKSLHYEVLQGDKKGISSVRVNDKYRVEFTTSEITETEDIITVCNIIELSNHYK